MIFKHLDMVWFEASGISCQNPILTLSSFFTIYPNLNKSAAPDLGAAALPRADRDAVAGDRGLSPDAGRG